MIPEKKSRAARTEKIPKQFVLSSDRYIITEKKVSGIPGPKLDCYHNRHVQRHHSNALYDLDFMMPARVREVLESEGLENKVIDKTIGQSEEVYKYLHLHMAEQNRKGKRSKVSNKTKDFEDKSVKLANRREKRESRGKPWTEHPVSSQQLKKEETSKLCNDMQNEIDNVQSEIQRTKWLSEKHIERITVGPSFNSPRVVLVSSKVPKHTLLQKTFKDEHILPVYYDYEEWTFSDIIKAVQQKLETHKRGCKAKSILIFCQGGPGYMYLLRNCVVTPQKMEKKSYHGLVEFWQEIGSCISKLTPEEAAVHIMGCRLIDNDQGRKLLPVIQRHILPNIVKVESPSEDTELGKGVLELYFRYDRYIIWRSHQNTNITDIDFDAEEQKKEEREEGQIRSWTSLAGDVSEDD
ncbi:hypothetical protein CHS0354_022594 [Potamilus streckersoni]|uniref:NMDA receptor synaptonuclear signaling and neuronal migration factor n=1 Tax=Potamilus streckersoni TaxID=2493646 RepID=A0AAE0SUM8_9BIVA|nr:hypothetical protein CHS0354_022594 [Potamilus streckersoni]